MAYITRFYGTESYWNTHPEDDFDLNSLPLYKATSTLFSTGMTDSDGVLEWQGIGNFFYGNESASFSSLRGTLTESSFYTNGALVMRELSTPGYDITRTQDYSYWINTVLAGNDEFYGSFDTAQSDGVRGGTGNDRFFGGGDSSGNGGDQFVGESGIDTSVYRGNHSEYTILKTRVYDQIRGNGSPNVDGFVVQDKVTNRDGKDSLVTTERLQFADVKVALDLDGNAGQVAKILGAVFGKAAVANKSYAGIGLSYLDGGMSYADLSALAINAAGASTPEQVVNLLWTNVVGSAPTAADARPFINMLNTGTSIGALGVLAEDTSLNTTNINLVGLSLTGLEYV